jgi:hypothetical protein
MDEKEQRQFIRFLATQWKDCVRELFGYQLFVQYLRQMNFEGIEELLDECRRSPIVQKKFGRETWRSRRNASTSRSRLL